MDTEQCRQFRETLAEGLESSPLHLASIDRHAAECPDCATFRARLAAIDRLAAQVGEIDIEPRDDARERLHAGWRHLAVQTSWLDRFKYWHRFFFEPQVLRPLAPHAAMIVGFMFFTYCIVFLQIQTGLLTVKVPSSQVEIVMAAAPAAPIQADIQVFKV
jgi:hypothetical protein